MIPCWDEEAVIEQMLEHNLTVIDYENYDVWLGVYPNDDATLAKVSACEARFGRVHYAVCPHDGPTTKADCLNWIYDGIAHAEQQRGESYDVLLQHDAEDLIHRDALKRIHENIGRFDMIQIPVFPLATPLRNATHGTYCDFFADFHMKELRQRAEFGGFVPSAGVGTAYRRKALEALRLAKNGRVFDEECLTEDYAVGFDLYRFGCSQTLLHADAAPWPRIGVERDQPRGLPVATRAYFPRRLREAVRQRTRWVLGIALQSWGNFGWRADGRQLYWLWRDRKGLVGHPVSMLANLIFCYGLVSWIGSIEDGSVWRFGGLLASGSWLLPLLVINSVLIVWRQLVRGYFSQSPGLWMAAGAQRPAACAVGQCHQLLRDVARALDLRLGAVAGAVPSLGQDHPLLPITPIAGGGAAQARRTPGRDGQGRHRDCRERPSVGSSGPTTRRVPHWPRKPG